MTSPWTRKAKMGQALQVSPSGRSLRHEDGTPFFYLGDTAWQLFARLNLAQGEAYLRDRSEKGFTVIQCVLLAELDPLKPNSLGEPPLHDNDPEKPNEAYFRHADDLIRLANSLGLRMGLLPAWGSYLPSQGAVGVLNPQNARSYGRFLGERYKDCDVIWILGGDRNPIADEDRATIRVLSAGLKDGDGGRHLQTYHPCGPGHSSDWFHEEDWLDFNMIQSSHAASGFDNGLMIEKDRAKEPVKPTLDGEPRYEGLVKGFYFWGANPLDVFDDADARHAAYMSVFAGACGHTYGHGSIWQMVGPGYDPVLWARVPWFEAIHHPGSRQMGFLRSLMEARAFVSLEPCPEALLDAPRTGPAKARSLRSEDGSTILVYIPHGDPVTVNLNLIPSPHVVQSWFNPRTGEFMTFHTGVNAALTFTPPTSGRGQDWVLVLDSPEAGWKSPSPWAGSGPGE